MKTESSMRFFTVLLLVAKAAALDIVKPSDALLDAPGSVLDLEGQLLTMISASAGLDLKLSPAVNATVMDAEVDQLAQGLAKLKFAGKGKATPEMAGFVKTVGGMINNDMIPKMKAAHKKDVKTMKVIDAAFLKCQGNKLSYDSKVKKLITKSASTSKGHRSCRVVENRMFFIKKTCISYVAALKSDMQGKCRKIKPGVPGSLYRDPASAWTQCKAKGAVTYKVWLQTMKKSFTGKAKAYLRAKLLCEVATAKYKKENKICNRKIALWRNKKAGCNGRQVTLEADTCSAGRQHVAGCKEYRTCYQQALRAKYRTQPGIQKSEKDRKVELRGLKRIECLLGVFAGDEGVNEKKIEFCKKKTHSTKVFDIRYKRAPTRQRCGATPSTPCNANYHSKYYRGLPRKAQPKTCKTCSLSNSGFGVDPVYWLSADNFDTKANTWMNKGSGPDRRNVVGKGSATLDLISGYGAKNSMVALTGGPETVLNFGQLLPGRGRHYTFCSLTKYTGNRYRGRILQGSGRNWLHGHWATRKGVVFKEGWQTSTGGSRLKNIMNWVAVCSKTTGPAVRQILVDGKISGTGRATNVAHSYPHGGIWVNGGNFANEKSSFAISDVMVWDTSLSTAGMQKAMSYLLGKLRKKDSKRGLAQKKQLVKGNIKPLYWLKAEDFDIKANTWKNKGTGKKVLRGVIMRNSKKPVMAVESGRGARAQILNVKGDINTALDFGVVMPRNHFTICSLTRYTGRHRNRILTAKRRNVLFGHWATRVGVSFVNGWKVNPHQPCRGQACYQWLAFCATNSNTGATGPNMMANGRNVGIWRGGHGTRGLNMVINDKSGSWRNERSDFALSEVKVWDQVLPTYAMKMEMQKLLKKLSTKTSAVQRAKLLKLAIAANAPDKKK